MDNLCKYILSKQAASPAETLVEQQQLQGLSSNMANPAGPQASNWMQETEGKIPFTEWLQQQQNKEVPSRPTILGAPVEALRTAPSGEFVELPVQAPQGTEPFPAS